MSRNDREKAARKAGKAARKAARRAERQVELAPAVRPSLAGRVDGFMARHAPSDTDLRWYRMLKYFAPVAVGLGFAAAAVIVM